MITEQKTNYAILCDKITKNSKIAIWGTSEPAINLLNYIKAKRNDINVEFFIDSKKKGDVDNIPIYSDCDFMDYLNNVDNIIVTSYHCANWMKMILNSLGFYNVIIPDKKFFLDESYISDLDSALECFKYQEDKDLYKMIWEVRENIRPQTDLGKYFSEKHKNFYLAYPQNQYLDYINKDAIQTVIDGGANNGLHSIIFEHTFKNCKKVYSFEPCFDDFKKPIYDAMIKRKPKIEVVRKALWNKNENLKFLKAEHTGGSTVKGQIDLSGMVYETIEIEAITMDSFVQSNNIEKIDFIKLDVENSEMHVLEGACETIKKHRPQMAICIYHSKEHFGQIPVYLKRKLDNYTLRLGHYNKIATETVLYAIPDELL